MDKEVRYKLCCFYTEIFKALQRMSVEADNGNYDKAVEFAAEASSAMGGLEKVMKEQAQCE